LEFSHDGVRGSGEERDGRMRWAFIHHLDQVGLGKAEKSVDAPARVNRGFTVRQGGPRNERVDEPHERRTGLSSAYCGE